MIKRMWKSWGEAYQSKLKKGWDHGWAAYYADTYCSKYGIK